MREPDDRAALAALITDRAGADDVELRERDGASSLVLRNEFATVRVSLDRAANGVRLVLTDAESGRSVALDPLELEAISRMSHRDFDGPILDRDATGPAFGRPVTPTTPEEPL